MSIIQKLILDKQLTDNNQIIVRDETGSWNPSNTTGYGGDNGNPVTDIVKYRFVLTDLVNNVSYTQVQSDDTDNPDEYYNPSIARIANKENVQLDADNFSLLNFKDGLYKLQMFAQMKYVYYGDGFAGAETIVNVSGAQTLYDNYKYILVGFEIYTIEAIIDSTLVLNRPIVESFTTIIPLIGTSINFILSDNLKDCLDNNIAKFANNCGCEVDVNFLNSISEIQLYLWGMQRSLDNNDIVQANEYLLICKKLCKSLRCNCNG